MKPITIIDAGLAGYAVAREFRKLDRTTPRTIITADDSGFYSKPMLSSVFAGAGHWHAETTSDNRTICRVYDAQGAMTGFGVAPHDAASRQLLMAGLGLARPVEPLAAVN